MRSSLDVISNWEQRLKQSRFRVAALAKACKISERELRRYIQDKFHVSAHEWIALKRMKMARMMLNDGTPVKQVSSDLDFKRDSHFSREFRRFHGASPTLFRASAEHRKAQMADLDK